MMSIPTYCANPLCGETAIKPIHWSSQRTAIDAVDGPQLFAHQIVYRCSQCGNTWAIHGNSSTDYLVPGQHSAKTTAGSGPSSRVW